MITINKYVSKKGHKYSYTTSLKNARTFETVEQAKKELCPENEHVCVVSDIITTTFKYKYYD
jgi:hypothetical protein